MTTDIVSPEHAKALADRKLTFAEVLRLVGNPFEVSSEPQAAAVHVPEITKEQREALLRIVQLYGVVIPAERRVLAEGELAALMEERETIVKLLSFLVPRKDNSIRETISHHFDVLIEQDSSFDAENPPPKDAKGHYAVKQEVPAPGTGKVWQRIVSNGKPTFTDADVERLHTEGLLTREQYLSLTKTPEVKRVFDEEKARKAIKKDPELLRILARAARPGTTTTVIKVGDDD